MSDVTMTGNADFSGIEKAFQKMAKENLRLLDQINKNTQANNKAAQNDKANKAEQARMAKAANDLMEKARTPLQKYDQELAKATKTLGTQKGAQAALAVEKQRLLEILRTETGLTARKDAIAKKAATEQQAAATKQAALQKEAVALMERLRGPTQRYNAELAKAKAHFDANRIGAADFAAEKQRLLGILAQENSAVNVVKGSYQALEKELDDQVRKLKGLAIGTKEFDRQRIKVDQLRAALNRNKSSITGQAAPIKANTSALGDQMGQLKNMAAQYVGLYGIIQSINFELEKKSRIEKDAASKTKTLDQAIAAALPNIAPEDRGGFRAQVRDESLRLGVTQADYANTAGIAISAGAGDLDRAAEILDELFTVTAGDAGQAQALGGAALDMTSLAGNDDIEGAIGQLAAVQQKVRATDMAMFAKNIAPSVAATTAGGENVDAITVERSLEIGAVLSQLLKDTQGDKTATALSQLASKMDGFAPELGQKQQIEAKLAAEEKKLGESKAGTKAHTQSSEKVAKLREQLKGGGLSSVTQEQAAKFKETRDFDERLQLLRSNIDLSRQFTADLKQGKLKNALREFTEGTDRAVNLDTEISAAVPSMEDGRANFEDLKKAVISNTNILRADNKDKAIEEFHATGGEAGIVGQARKVFDSTRENVNLAGPDMMASTVQDMGLEFRVAMGNDRIESMIEILENAKEAVSPADAVKMDAKLEIMRDLLQQQQDFKKKEAAAAEPAMLGAVNLDALNFKTGVTKSAAPDPSAESNGGSLSTEQKATPETLLMQDSLKATPAAVNTTIENTSTETIVEPSTAAATPSTPVVASTDMAETNRLLSEMLKQTTESNVIESQRINAAKAQARYSNQGEATA